MALNPVSCNIQPLVRRCVAIFMVPFYCSYQLIELDFRFMQLDFIYYCAVLLLDGVYTKFTTVYVWDPILCTKLMHVSNDNMQKCMVSKN
jgi:hypothetical protein